MSAESLSALDGVVSIVFDGFAFDESGAISSTTQHLSGSFAMLKITATRDIDLTIDWRVSCERTHDKLRITQGMSTELVLASGEESGTLLVSLRAGQSITVEYEKDGSVDIGDDCATLTGVTITY